MLSGLVACTEFVEAKRAGTEVGALVKAALVADDFAGVEGWTAPRRGLCCVAIEAATTEVLGFLWGCVVCVLDWESCMWGEVGHGDRVTGRGGGGLEEGRLRWYDYGRIVFKFNGKRGVVDWVKIVVGRVGGWMDVWVWVELSWIWGEGDVFIVEGIVTRVVVEMELMVIERGKRVVVVKVIVVSSYIGKSGTTNEGVVGWTMIRVWVIVVQVGQVLVVQFL
jgi:hypothetical protein